MLENALSGSGLIESLRHDLTCVTIKGHFGIEPTEQNTADRTMLTSGLDTQFFVNNMLPLYTFINLTH